MNLRKEIFKNSLCRDKKKKMIIPYSCVKFSVSIICNFLSDCIFFLKSVMLIVWNRYGFLTDEPNGDDISEWTWWSLSMAWSHLLLQLQAPAPFLPRSHLPHLVSSPSLRDSWITCRRWEVRTQLLLQQQGSLRLRLHQTDQFCVNRMWSLTVFTFIKSSLQSIIISHWPPYRNVSVI